MSDTPIKRTCYRNVGDCLEGDSIHVECRSPGKWNLYRMTGQHKGWKCKIQKNAKAIILKTYTNVKK